MSHVEDVSLWYRYAYDDPEAAAAIDGTEGLHSDKPCTFMALERT